MSVFDPSVLQAELTAMMPMYERIMDCIKGNPAIKSKRTVYLPMPDPTNQSDENIARYNNYLHRAIFYNATARTLNSLVGIAFNDQFKDLEIPEKLKYIQDNVDGSGITIEQQMHKVLAGQLSLGRIGLFVDYSGKVKGDSATLADELSGNIRAVIRRYEAIDIVYASTSNYGVLTKLSVVILKESYAVPEDDGYKDTYEPQYRVLLLNDGIYTQEVFRANKDNTYVKVEELSSTPKEYTGKAFDHIPFTFVGSENNDATFDEPPLLSIADLNIGHYQNSADAEEASFIVGQPTAVLTGLNEQWIKGVFGGELSLGSRGAILLPEGGTGSLLQPIPNLLPVNGMDKKELQIAALGGLLASNAQGTSNSKTATEVNRNTIVADSTLTTAVMNLEQAYNFCFKQVALYTGSEVPVVRFNTIFSGNIFDANVYNSLVAGVSVGVNTLEDAYNYLDATAMLPEEYTFEGWKANLTVKETTDASN